MLGHAAHIAEAHQVKFVHKEPNVQTQVQDDIQEIVRKFKGVDIVARIGDDVNTSHGTFLPGISYSREAPVVSVLFVLLAIVWFAIFFKCIYQNDREEVTSGRWSKHLKSENLEAIDEKDLHVRPDIMLVFHHPQHEYQDRESKVSADIFEKVKVKKTTKCLPRVDEMVKTAGSGTHTLGEARIAFMQDLYQDLYDMGLSVLAFSSCDEDEIFVSVRLNKPEAVHAFLTKNKAPLEINQDLIPKLGIGQSPEVPRPVLPYHPMTIQRLHDARVIQNPDEKEVYRVYHNHAGKGRIISRLDRIRLVYAELTKKVDLDGAVSSGLMVAWYPVHQADRIPTWKAAWGNLWLLLDASFVQPVLSLRMYFGVRVAFIFAWNGFYCKALLALLPLALVAATIPYLPLHLLHTTGTRMIIASNTVIILWSRIVYNQWKREEEYLSEVWSVQGDSDGAYLIRPSFRGTQKPTIWNSNETQKEYPAILSALRRAFTLFVTMFFCGLVAFLIYLWYDIFEGRLTLVSGLLLIVQVKVFQVVWDLLTPVLTEFENHKHNHGYYNSYLWKNFAFQAVNSYAAYVYIALKMQTSTNVCPDGDCITMFQGLLAPVQITLFLGNMALFVLSSQMVKFQLWYEVYKYKKANNGEEPPDRPRSEEESKMRKFRSEDQINIMCQLMLSLGFIILFGGFVPIMVPFCLLLFALNLRYGAKMLLSYYQRPFPRKLHGIGNWGQILQLLMIGGVVFSGFVIVTNSDAFSSAPLITKLTGFILYCSAMFVAWAIIDCILPQLSVQAKHLREQQTYVLAEIHRQSQTSQLATQSSQIQHDVQFEQLPIARAAWSEIYPLAIAEPVK